MFMSNIALEESLVSVIMCVFSEKEEWLRESIESVLNQTYLYFEFIIINDKPNRELNKVILEEYSKLDARIIVVQNMVNLGLTKSLNIGLKMAKGEYIARMDADDISISHRLLRQIDFLNANENIDFCGSFVKFIGQKFALFRAIITLPITNEEIRTEMLISNPIAHPTIMFRKKVLIGENSLLYDESVKEGQDFELWFRAISSFKFYNIEEVLLKYRISSNQVSTKGRSNQNIVANNIRNKGLAAVLNVSEEELRLHNNICNGNKSKNIDDLLDTEVWFFRLIDEVKNREFYDASYLQLRLNRLIIISYIKSLIGIGSFRYFRSNMYLNVGTKTKSRLFFILNFLKINLLYFTRRFSVKF